VPPSWTTPTSNDTRVRVDGFSKIIATVLPANGIAWPSPDLCAAFYAQAVIKYRLQIVSRKIFQI
jgi:hypothetical protein